MAAQNFNEITIEVNKKIDGKYSPVGKVAIFVPTLLAFGLEAQIAKDKDGAELIEGGLPVYDGADAKALNWLQGAIEAQVKAQARNKLKPGTADLKDGAAIATDFETLTAEGDRAGNAEALQAIRNLKASFAKWVAGLGKSAAAQQLLNGLFANKQALAVQTDANKGKMSQYVSDFAETLDEAALAAGQKYLQSLIDVCSGSVEADDF